MFEKRNLKRRHLIYYLRIMNRDTNELLGHLVDITAEGIMVISENQLEINKNFNFRMMLPKEIVGKEMLEFSAKSLWSKKDINPDFYDTGFKIDDMTEADSLRIDQLIHHFGFQD
ncbi:MAG: PilZ domain-containing protein [Anaerolineaceae bacterium]|nr:PilZ domain-containing protein [Anaerolineaceae bacterium]